MTSEAPDSGPFTTSRTTAEDLYVYLLRSKFDPVVDAVIVRKLAREGVGDSLLDLLDLPLNEPVIRPPTYTRDGMGETDG